MSDQPADCFSRFMPFNADSFEIEAPKDYAERMISGPLPQWPREVLIEWLHRHWIAIGDYAFLGFERMRFEREVWPAERIPGDEAYCDPTFRHGASSVFDRAEYDGGDWLAQYMIEHGTWNTPIILLRTNGIIEHPLYRPIRQPLHLLEGHSRLDYFIQLREAGQALAEHDVWIVELHNE